MENQNDNNTIDVEGQGATVTPLVVYDVTKAQIAELRTKFSGLSFETTPKYEEGRKAIATVRQQRELAEAKAKAERDEAARQAAIKAEKEAAEKAERDQIAAEEARVAEAERKAEHARRLEALKPDAEKLKAFAADINTLTPPDVKSDEARQMLANSLSILAGVVTALETFGVDHQATAAE